jgi:ATP-dependent exoDNAse (exonuclease V) alpha subunit
LEKGNVSDEDVAFINSLSRSLENEENCVHLFSRNIDVDIHNYTKIQTVAGELKIYKSVDEGSNYYLDKYLAPNNLGLKVGCPVMLLKNLSNVLVNGLRGIVFQMNPESVDVKFETEMKTITVNIQRCTLTTFDHVDKTVLAKRNQLPFIAAYAITVHKAQGMSLNNVVVHCEHCTQPGQLV